MLYLMRIDDSPVGVFRNHSEALQYANEVYSPDRGYDVEDGVSIINLPYIARYGKNKDGSERVVRFTPINRRDSDGNVLPEYGA
jgi:hypothetical protein